MSNQKNSSFLVFSCNYDAERDLLAIAKFLVIGFIKETNKYNYIIPVCRVQLQ